MKNFGMYKTLFKEKSGQVSPSIDVKPKTKYSAYKTLIERHEKIVREAEINSKKEIN